MRNVLYRVSLETLLDSFVKASSSHLKFDRLLAGTTLFFNSMSCESF